MGQLYSTEYGQACDTDAIIATVAHCSSFKTLSAEAQASLASAFLWEFAARVWFGFKFQTDDERVQFEWLIVIIKCSLTVDKVKKYRQENE